jgi:tetratricopeptide (TPR) repeat protein
VESFRWDYFVKGLAEYRAGRFAEAITLLKLGLPPRAASPLNDGPTYLVLAMAQFRLGEADKARESLAAALDLLERTLPRLDRGERYDRVARSRPAGGSAARGDCLDRGPRRRASAGKQTD